MSEATIEGTIPNFDQLVESAIEHALEDLNIGSMLREIDLSNYIDLDSLLYDFDYVDSDSAWDIAREVVSENEDGGGSNLYELNSMLDQVAEGRDCSDGNSFRDAVKAIVNAQILTGTSGASDGTIMTLKANGEEREIQAILTRRREYFDSLTNALSHAFEFDLRHCDLPRDWEALNETNGPQRFRAHFKQEADNKRHQQRDRALNDRQTVEINAYLYEQMKLRMRQYAAVATEAVKLIALLRTLHDGKTGDEAVRNSNSCRDAADYSTTQAMEIPESLSQTEENTDTDE